MTLRRNVRRGYDVEVLTLKTLKPIFPHLRRVGSLGYSEAHPDLVQDSRGARDLNDPILIVATKDTGRSPLMVHLAATDLVDLVQTPRLLFNPVAISVKARKQTWVAGLYAALKRATGGQ